MAKAIGTLGTIPTLTVAGRVFTDLTTLIRLYTRNGSNARATFRTSNGSAGYAVTTGKTLGIEAIKLNSDTSSNVTFNLAYSDNDVGIDSSTAYTNPVYLYGPAAADNFYATALPNGGGSGGSGAEFPIAFNVVALKYPGVLAGTGAHAQYMAWGYET